MMAPVSGFQPSNAPLPYPDDRNPPPSMGMGMIPPPMGTAMMQQAFQPYGPIDFTPQGYPQTNPPTDNSPPSQKARTLQQFESIPNTRSGSMATIAHTGNFDDMPPMPEPPPKESPKAKTKGKGRGKANSNETSPKGGRARTTSQGTVIPIPNVGREVALKEQAMKRRRVDGDQVQDNTEEAILEDMLTRDTVEKGLASRKRKNELKPPRREHHACDRCFRNKTKCHRSVDGKQPGKYFPCDYCTTINGICTTAVATSMKPESWPVAEETHWKTWKFKDIVSDAVETDNLRVRKELAAMQEKFSHHEKLHECVKAELETERAHKATLQKSLDAAYAFIKNTQRDTVKTNKILAAVTRQRDRYKGLLRNYIQNSVDAPDAPSICSFESSQSLSAAQAILEGDDDEEDDKPPFPDSEEMAEQEAADQTAEQQVARKPSGQDFPDLFQKVSIGERLCNDILLCNEYIDAYFTNIQPLAPVLHREAFLRLYRMYGMKAVAVNIGAIYDGSSRDGRAVALICSVLALGAFSLVETRSRTEGQDEDRSELIMLPHFGEALGFYKCCIRLIGYTHDTIETMITYLLMAQFAILTGDMKEAFRRLQSVQSQAIAMNLTNKLGNMHLASLYDTDLWPGVTNLIMSEMVKRTWLLFKIHLSNIALDSGLSANLDETIHLGQPAEFDDEHVGFEAISTAEFASRTSPNPISFLIALGGVAKMSLATAGATWIREKTNRWDQLGKCRRIWDQMTAWQASLPTFLDFSKYSSAFAHHQQLKLQRAYLETQFTSLKMTMAWLISNLDPLLLHKAQFWDVADAMSDTFKNGKRVISIVEEQGLPTEVYRFYHWDAIRTAGTMRKLMHHVDMNDTLPTNNGEQLDVNKIVETCRAAVLLSRKLIPRILASAENNIDAELDEFMLGKQATSMIDIASYANGGIAALMDSSSLFHPAPFNFNHSGFDFLQEPFDGKQFFDQGIKREEMNEYLPSYLQY